MATPPNPRIYMADDWSWALGGTTAWQNFYVWDGLGSLAASLGYGTGTTRGVGFLGTSSGGHIGWVIIDLDTGFAIANATVGMCWGYNQHAANGTNLVMCQFSEDVGNPGVAQSHVYLDTDASNHIRARNGDGTILGTSDYILPVSAEDGSGPTYHIEAIVTVHPSAGTVRVWVNDVPVLDLSGKNTKNGGTGVVGYVELHATSGRNIAEWLVHDGSARLGSQWRVAYVPVAQVGTYTSGTASAGTKLECVDDTPTVPETEDANYAILDATALPKKLSFVSGPMPTLALQIRDVHPQIVVKKSDGGTNTGKVGLRSDTSEVYNTSAQGIPDAWWAYRLALRTDIIAGNPLWTIPTAEAAEVIVDRET